MRIGILTFHWANNYGAVLQAYGLANALQTMGHTVRFIDYTPPGHGLRWWQGWGFRSGRELPARVLWRLRFEWFRKRHLPTTPQCRSRTDLTAVSRRLDAVIVGSDQVWNGHLTGSFDPTYFLDFVDDHRCRRISYAACFGDTRQPQETVDRAGALLTRFHALSVRNEMSADLVESFSAARPEVVLDPTLLCDYSQFLGATSKAAPYIAVYYLAHPQPSHGLEVLRIVKKRLNLPMVLIGTDADVSWADRTVLSAGPVDWLRILKGAAFVCTDSFHGTIFSIKLKKAFIVWRGYRPDRLQDYLGRCGLQDRLLSQSDEATLHRLIETSIDYAEVANRLAPHLARSKDFLAKALAN